MILPVDVVAVDDAARHLLGGATAVRDDLGVRADAQRAEENE